MGSGDRDVAPSGKTETPEHKSAFLRQVMVFYGVGALFLLLAMLLRAAASVLLVAFAGVLLAVLLDEAGDWVLRWLPMPRGLALGIIVVSTLIALGLIGWLFAPRVADQTTELIHAVPQALQRLQVTLQRYGLVRDLLGSLPSTDAIASHASSMLARAGLFFSGVLGAIASLVIAIFVAIYLAARPSVYVDGVITLIPMAKRPRAREVLHEIRHSLGQWLVGKLLSMVIIGIVTALGLALLQVPLALALGVLAGLLDFIPYIGPVLAGAPAVLIGFTESTSLALYVLLLFIGLQAAEGYLLLPLIERRTVSLPPALTILMQTLLGTFFGLAGVALATPLTVVLAVLMTMLYVQDGLGDRVRIPGEQ